LLELTIGKHSGLQKRSIRHIVVWVDRIVYIIV
jgi:hypothetical protein